MGKKVYRKGDIVTCSHMGVTIRSKIKQILDAKLFREFVPGESEPMHDIIEGYADDRFAYSLEHCDMLFYGNQILEMRPTVDPPPFVISFSQEQVDALMELVRQHGIKPGDWKVQTGQLRESWDISERTIRNRGERGFRKDRWGVDSQEPWRRKEDWGAISTGKFALKVGEKVLFERNDKPYDGIIESIYFWDFAKQQSVEVQEGEDACTYTYRLVGCSELFSGDEFVGRIK